MSLDLKMEKLVNGQDKKDLNVILQRMDQADKDRDKIHQDIKFIKENRPYPQFTLIHQGVMGYNIAAFGKVYYGMRQMDGDLKISEKVTEHDSRESAEASLKNKEVIVSSCLDSLIKTIKTERRYPKPQLLEENWHGFNIVVYSGMFYAIKRGVNINLDEVEEEFLKSTDDVLMAKNLTDLKILI